MFGWFKRSNKQVLRDNKARGDEGERLVKSKYQIAGYDVERTGRGSDYKVSRKNWLTGKKDTRLVEVKTGNAKLSPLQKKRKRSWGKRYVVERVPNSPLSQPMPSASEPARRKGRRGRSVSPSKSFWGFGGGGSKRGKKSPESSFWGSSSSTSSSRGSKRGKKSPESSFWGSSSSTSSSRGSKRGKKSPESSFWGSSSSSSSSSSRGSKRGKKSSSSSSSRGSKRGKKSPESSFWGSSSSSSSGGSKRGRRSPSTSIWGSSSGKKGKPSIW